LTCDWSCEGRDDSTAMVLMSKRMVFNGARVARDALKSMIGIAGIMRTLADLFPERVEANVNIHFIWTSKRASLGTVDCLS